MSKIAFKTTQRHETNQVKIGKLLYGGNNHVVLQTMTTTKTHQITETIAQIKEAIAVGCELIRVAIFDERDAKALPAIKKAIPIPVVADIHFNSQLALKAIQYGADKIRINPGNISNLTQLKTIIKAANEKSVPIRIGINSGSIPRKYQEKYGATAKALVEAMTTYVNLFEQEQFTNLVLSIKATHPKMLINANQELSRRFKHPLHLGLTEAGYKEEGLIKSSAGLAPLLMQGIGNSVRISLTTQKISEEIWTAKHLLDACEIPQRIVNLISCPTCGRLQFEMHDLVQKVYQYVRKLNKRVTVAILGCAVNGIGEGKQADIGLAGGVEKAIIFEKGKIVKTVPQEKAFEELTKLIDQFDDQLSVN